MAAKKSDKSSVKAPVAVDASSAPAAETPARARKAAKPKITEVLAPAVTVAAVAPAVAVAAPVKPEESAIRARAHALFLAEGGDAFENWLRAERELAAGA